MEKTPHQSWVPELKGKIALRVLSNIYLKEQGKTAQKEQQEKQFCMPIFRHAMQDFFRANENKI